MGGWVGESRSVGKTIRSEVEKMRELCWSEKGDLPMFEWCGGGRVPARHLRGSGLDRFVSELEREFL